MKKKLRGSSDPLPSILSERVKLLVDFLVTLQLFGPDKLFGAMITLVLIARVHNQVVMLQLILASNRVVALPAGIPYLFMDALNVLFEFVLSGRAKRAKLARVTDANVNRISMVR